MVDKSKLKNSQKLKNTKHPNISNKKNDGYETLLLLALIIPFVPP